MEVLLHPTYQPSILSFAVQIGNDIVWEVHDNYQKQTYRNRCYICSDQGKKMLNIPIRHVGGSSGRQKYRDVRLDNSYAWQRLHWRSLETAYRTSPFFEFYEDELRPLYQQSFEFLLDFNFKSIEILTENLGVVFPSEQSQSYHPNPEAVRDCRGLVNAKDEKGKDLPPYPQVFGERHGFISNLSMLDLLFNLGPESLSYLEKLENIPCNG